jgi:hypothetical protein
VRHTSVPLGIGDMTLTVTVTELVSVVSRTTSSVRHAGCPCKLFRDSLALIKSTSSEVQVVRAWELYFMGVSMGICYFDIDSNVGSVSPRRWQCACTS